jgi:hypothetical protein
MFISITKHFNHFKDTHTLRFIFNGVVIDENSIVYTISKFYDLVYVNSDADTSYNCVIRMYFEDSDYIVSFNTMVKYNNRKQVIESFFEYLHNFEDAYISTLEVKSIEFQYYKFDPGLTPELKSLF